MVNFRGRGKAQCHQKFTIAQDIAPWPGAKLLDWYLTPATGTGNDTGRPVRNQRGSRIGCWRRVTEIAPDRGTALNLRPPYELKGIHQARVGARDDGIAIDAMAGYGSSQLQAVLGTIRQGIQVWDFLDINDQLQVPAPFPKLHNEVRPAGQCARLRALGCQQ
jgi:hypothetical protein